MYRKHLLRISRDLNCALCQHQLTFCDCKTFKGEIEVQRIFHFCSDDPIWDRNEVVFTWIWDLVLFPKKLKK